MKIAMFTDTFEPQVNGVITSIKIFTEELRNRGHEVHIFIPECPNQKCKDKFIHKIPSVSFSPYPGYRIAVPFKTMFDPLFKETKFDVVHVHTPFSIGVAGAGLAKFYKIRRIVTFHTMIPDYTHYFVKEPLSKVDGVMKLSKNAAWKYMVWFHNRFDVVISPSEAVAQELKKRGIRKKIEILPTGVKIQKVKESKEELRKKYRFAKDDKLILHVGRITKEKNITLIIDSVKELIKKDNNIKLVITSDGPAKQDIMKKVHLLGIDKNVIFTGFLPKESLMEYYKLSDVFAMASKTETQGIVLIEAVMQDLPIVSIDAPVVSDFVRENNAGLIARKSSFGEKLKQVLESKESFKFDENLLKKYDISVCTDKLLKIYKPN